MEAILGVLLLILAIALYISVVLAYFVYAVPVIAGLGGVAAVFLILADHVEALMANVRKMPRSQEGREPAIKQYFYSAAWSELRLATAGAYSSALTRIRTVGGRLASVISGEPELVMWPLGAGLFVAFGIAVIVGFVIFAVATSLHAILIGVVLAATAAAAVTLRGMELLSMFVRRIYLVCPNRDCHRRIALPLYRCASCGAQHHALLPGSYGTVRRRCKCGAWLPTLFLLGRSSVPAFCPHESCRKPLNEVIGSARNVHIPVVGGAFVGKTAFLTATMIEIRKKSSVEMTFPESADQSAFEAAAQRFARGVPVDKTAGASPNAMLLRIKDTRRGKSLVYIYDAAGELYSGASDLGRQNFLEHTSAVALLIDPFSLAQVRIDRARDLSAYATQLRASEEPAGNVYARMMLTIREQRGDKDRMPVPLAVIVTKIDAVGIENDIRALQAAVTEPDVTSEQRFSTAVREWLMQNGEGNLVRSAERDFKHVGYFACSALGRMPVLSSAAFVPQGVLTPFEWLAESAGVHLF